jgi:membrane protein implicated in regulation of membrane protease activity
MVIFLLILLLVAAAAGVLGAVLKATLVLVLSLVLAIALLVWIGSWYARRRFREFQRGIDVRMDQDRRRRAAYDVGSDRGGSPRLPDGG